MPDASLAPTDTAGVSVDVPRDRDWAKHSHTSGSRFGTKVLLHKSAKTMHVIMAPSQLTAAGGYDLVPDVFLSCTKFPTLMGVGGGAASHPEVPAAHFWLSLEVCNEQISRATEFGERTSFMPRQILHNLIEPSNDLF